MLVHSIERASSINKRLANDSPMPITSFNASAACTVPIMPTSGANTPMVAHCTSSNT
jgi:hypothetical protein